MSELLKFNRQTIEKLIKQGKKDEIRKYDLRGADLIGLNLRYADLHGANLLHADLCWADLYGANLHGANLPYANLSDADLRRANLCGANLCRAVLSGANLSEANLSHADLFAANLCDANLFEANLSYADSRYANLHNAYLIGANLEGVYCAETAFFHLQCPEKGSFIGFKRIDEHIVGLEIPASAKRSSATSRRCRCSEAKVLSITLLDGTDDGTTSVCSGCDPEFVYRVGETVKVDNFDEDRWNEYSTGIHFFMTRSEAVMYIC